MKILVVSDYVAGDRRKGCNYQVRFSTAIKYAAKGHYVTFIAPSASRWKLSKIEKVESKVRIVETPGLIPTTMRNGGFDPFDIFYKASHVLFNKYDVIHVTNGHRPANFLSALIGKYLKRAVIVDECWEWLGKGGYADSAKAGFARIKALYDAFFEVPFKSIYDDIVAISSLLQQRFNKRGNAVVIHGGSEVDVLQAYSIEEARHSLGVNEDLFIIGMSNVSLSDHDENRAFFESCSQLVGVSKNIRLLATGPDETYIQAIVNDYALNDSLIFPGWVSFDTYNKHLSACDMYVLPYPNSVINAARWPNKVSDFLCLDRPVLTNPTGDLKELFERYSIGFLCENTPEAYFQLISGLLDEGKKALASRCTDSLYLAHDVLAFDVRIDRFISIFENRLDIKRQVKLKKFGKL